MSEKQVGSIRKAIAFARAFRAFVLEANMKDLEEAVVHEGEDPKKLAEDGKEIIAKALKQSESRQDHGRYYSEESFWEKISTFALRAGKEIVEKALVLYYCLLDLDTPAWARTVIVGALGYFILPLDAIPDFTPLTGFLDDLGALTAALGVVAMHIKPEHRERAHHKVREWFG